MMLIATVIKIDSKGGALHWSERVGKGSCIFKMPKFRTMILDTPQVATHLMIDPLSYYTAFGKFLRKTSLDEIPQLISIIRGDMSFVGPRPALFNQKDLINLRKRDCIDTLTPGLTGWAQVNGRDELTIEKKVELDKEYLIRQSISLDFYIIWLTIMKVFKRENISH
tara:strand:+ start:821 stop:1321 length:501 start_codon:yes stop_codon:yes gene_type:complete